MCKGYTSGSRRDIVRAGRVGTQFLSSHIDASVQSICVKEFHDDIQIFRLFSDALFDVGFGR